MKRTSVIEGQHDCGDGVHQVATINSSSPGPYRRQPCEQCPWRKDNPVGAFPAEAYRHSTVTAHDMSGNIFACHMSGAKNPTACAGFLLKGAYHNMAVRMSLIDGTIKIGEVSDGGFPLYESYRDMAVANGVDPADPILKKCR